MPNASLPVRAGRTLAELLVALAVSGVFFALLSIAFIGHERLVSGSTAIIELRGQVRQAHQILPILLRAAARSDFFAVADTLVDVGYPIGSAVTCLPSTATQILLAPDSIAIGQRLAAWVHPPRTGDLAHVFDAGTLPGTGDDHWWTASVGGLVQVPNACAGSPLLDPVADATHRARALTLTGWLGGAPPLAIPVGAVVTFTRRTRAFLYASSGSEYLGISDFDPTLARWSVVQPVSGPYARAGTNPGVQFQVFDSLGGSLPLGATPLGVAAVTLRVRGQTVSQVRIPGMRGGVRTESLAADIALRNR